MLGIYIFEQTTDMLNFFVRQLNASLGSLFNLMLRQRRARGLVTCPLTSSGGLIQWFQATNAETLS